MTKAKYPMGITQEMVSAAETYLLAKVLEEAVEPVVTQYSKEVLEKYQFKASSKWDEFDELKGSVILDPKLTYLLSEDDWAIYSAETFKARDLSGLKVSRPDNCPYLEAKNHRVIAENALIDAVAKHPKLGNLRRHLLTLDERAKLLDLILRFLAPHVRNGSQILEEAHSSELGKTK